MRVMAGEPPVTEAPLLVMEERTPDAAGRDMPEGLTLDVVGHLLQATAGLRLAIPRQTALGEDLLLAMAAPLPAMEGERWAARRARLVAEQPPVTEK
jgi:hypothetical protein